MKTLKKLLLFAIIVSFAACKGGNNKDLIAKKWKVDAEAFKAMAKEEIEKMKKDKPEEAKMAESMIDMTVGMFSSLTMEFKADGTYETAVMGQTQKGKWSLSDDGKTLTTEDEKGKKDTMKIQELSDSKMVIMNEKEGEKASPMSKIVFIPA